MKSISSYKAVAYFLCGALTISTLAACGASPAPENTGRGAGLPEAGKTGSVHQTLLASVDLSYGKVAFHKLATPDGRWRIAISEMASSRIKTTPFKKFITGNKLTSLEVFQSVAPGKQVPRELRDIHSIEASRLGRKNEEVKYATFDSNAPVEKSLTECASYYNDGTPPADCQSYWGTVQGITNPSQWLPVAPTLDDAWHFTMSDVAMGTCNESDDPESVTLATSTDENWNLWDGGQVPAHTAWDWYLNDSYFGAPVVCPEPTQFNPNPICSETEYPARYAILGQGTPTYHVVSAEKFYSHCQPPIN